MLQFGVVGTNVISEWFAGACRATGGRAEAVAVCSRELTRARDFADRIGAPRAFDDLAAMAQAVDAVYIASPNALHREQAVLAAEAGRHVLVEKTMGTSLPQVQSIFAAAERAGVVAMEAMRNVHTPAHRLLREALPRLGTLRHARFEKLQYSSRYDRFRAGVTLNAFDPALGNSALADIGVYCLQPALDLFGAPLRTVGASLWLSNGFEAGGSLLLDYRTLVVDLAYSKVASGLGPSTITGEDASLSFDDPGELSRVVLHERGGRETVLLDGPPVGPADTMVHEVLAFADQVDAGATDPHWRELSLLARRVMDEQLGRRTS
ncbi:Gfo/Idh/MocA family protein [Micropruina sp.]|uniref:Gfo/Idh/MocA family protein n=1 Tax=Micropruina sp. TaxID=2737536 RepID=UPI0039E49817